MGHETFIRVKTQFVGFHRWPEAPDVVGFLRNAHRHVFHVNATIETKHGDRDLEFFRVIQFLNEEPIETLEARTVLDLGSSLSCEHMAGFLVDCIRERYGDDRRIQVEVSEDGENGGIATWVV